MLESVVFLQSNPSPPGGRVSPGSPPRVPPVVGPKPFKWLHQNGLPAHGFRGCPKPAPGPAPLPPFPPGSPAPAPPGLGGQGQDELPVFGMGRYYWPVWEKCTAGDGAARTSQDELPVFGMGCFYWPA